MYKVLIVLLAVILSSLVAFVGCTKASDNKTSDYVIYTSANGYVIKRELNRGYNIFWVESPNGTIVAISTK